MTKTNLYNILKEVFKDYAIGIEEQTVLGSIMGCQNKYVNKFSRIIIGENNNKVYVYTHSKDPESEDSIWYFTTYFEAYGREIMIPNKFTREFIEEFLGIYERIIEVSMNSNNILSSINKLKYDSEHGDFSKYRDTRLDKILYIDI